MKSIVRFTLLLVVFALGWAVPAVSAEDTNQIKSLTLRECIERALANNLDIRIERINPTIQQWGVVGAQGAYDPLLTGGINYEDATIPTGGGSSVEDQQLQSNFGLGGRLPTGASYDLSAFDTRSSGTSSSNFLFTGNAGVSLTQPILRNFGLGVNSASIRVARKSQQIAVQQFVLQVINSVSDATRAYYELVFAIEDHKSKLEDLNQAKALLDENRKRVQIGVLSPLDVTQAEAGVAAREEAVIIGERVIRDNENVLKRFMSQNVMEFHGVSLVPVDYPVVQMVETDVARSIKTALNNRPDYLQARHELERRSILVKFNRNQLWPEIDLQGSYGLNGRSSTSFDNFVDNTASGNNPAWTIGVTVSVPLGNRQARANYNVARLQSEQQLLNLKRLEQDIIVGTDNAVRLVQSNLKRVEATRAASRLAEESLKAEEQKLRAGTSTSFLVLQAQAQLASARTAEIRARADYSESLVDLARTESTTLQQNNIVLDEKF